MVRYLLQFDGYSLVFVGFLSDERTGVSFVYTYSAGPSQRSLSRVRIPWDSRPYFTVSDLRLPFSSPPTTRRVTVEVLDPASTQSSQSHIATDGQSVSRSVSLGVEPHLGLMTRYLLLFDSYDLGFVGALSDDRTGLSIVYAPDPCKLSLSRVRVPWESRPYYSAWGPCYIASGWTQQETPPPAIPLLLLFMVA
jgi:hypothetical protein